MSYACRRRVACVYVRTSFGEGKSPEFSGEIVSSFKWIFLPRGPCGRDVLLPAAQWVGLEVKCCAFLIAFVISLQSRLLHTGWLRLDKQAIWNMVGSDGVFAR